MEKTFFLSCKSIFRRLTIFAAPLLCVGCGTFQLANGIYPPAGKSHDQQQTDILVCKDEAKLAANTTERQTGAFLLGMTIVGAPVAFEMEKSKQREVFSQCLTARGYRVTVPDDGQKKNETFSKGVYQPAAETIEITKKDSTVSAPKTVLVPSSVSSPRDDATQLEKLKGLKDRGVITEEEYNEKKKEILGRM